MLPLLPLLAAGIWGYNLYKFVELKSGNRLQRRNQDERNLDIFSNCEFRNEDKRVYNYNHFDRCVINIYLTGGKDEEHIKGKGSRYPHLLSEMAKQKGENLRKRKSVMQDPLAD